jgi:cyanate lyase
MNRDEITAAIVANRLTKGFTWQQLADAIGRPLVWTTAALLGQHPLPEASARQVAELLDLPAEAAPAHRQLDATGPQVCVEHHLLSWPVKDSHPPIVRLHGQPLRQSHPRCPGLLSHDSGAAAAVSSLRARTPTFSAESGNTFLRAARSTEPLTPVLRRTPDRRGTTRLGGRYCAR